MLKKVMLRPAVLFLALLAPLFSFFSDRPAVKPRDILTDPSFFEPGEKLPALPLLVINTDSGEDPAFDLLPAPSDQVFGASICNNDYAVGTMRTISGRKTERFSDIKIRVRGNTSAWPSHSQADCWKVPYKLKLSSPAELLDMGEENSFSEWILLKSGTNLNTFTGYALSSLCGLDWQLPMKFVNVVLNGDWKGCYILTPAVEAESSRGLIGKNGFLFEEDAYWWKEDKPYFQLENQNPAMKYTVKYPKSSPLHDEKIKGLQSYMQEFENLLLAGDEAYTDCIDIESFASYLLAQDIGGNSDGAGSNLFLYTQSGQSDSDPLPKVKAGPLWDFDGLFLMKDSWSASYAHGTFYFRQLKWTEAFFDLYLQKWVSLSPTLYASLEAEFRALTEENGTALQESWNLDARRWNESIKSFEEQKAGVLSFIDMRIGVIDRKLCLSIPDTYFIDVSDYTPVHGNIQYWIDFGAGVKDHQGMIGWAYCISDCDIGQVGVLYGDRVYLADRVSRPDVREYFSLESESDMFGFDVEYLSEEPLPLCIVDTENKILYVE